MTVARLGWALSLVILTASVILAELHYTVPALVCLLIGNALGFGSMYAWRRHRRPRPVHPLIALLETHPDATVWCSSFTAWDDNGLPVSGGGVTLPDGTVLAGKAPPVSR